jgi:hypothetical protein
MDLTVRKRTGSRFLEHFMNRASMVIAMAGMMFVSADAFAANSPGHAAIDRRQLANCMSKQMAANTSISDNEAAKARKDQMKIQNGQAGLSARAKQAILH